MATTVTIGGADATDVQVASATSLTCVVPAGTAGDTVDVVVSTSGDTVTVTDAYTYVPPATVEGVEPECFPFEAGSGTTEITITGTDFVEGTTVALLGAPLMGSVSDVTVVDSTTITATYTPPGSTPSGGTSEINFTVTPPGGTALTVSSTAAATPTVTSVTPATGTPAGGETVTIAGTSFGADPAMEPEVAFGGTAATITQRFSQSMQVTVPAGTGTVDVTVTNCAGTGTLTDAYTYVAAGPPVIVTVTPDTAPAGTNTFVVTGTGLSVVGDMNDTPAPAYQLAWWVDAASSYLLVNISSAGQTDTQFTTGSTNFPIPTTGYFVLCEPTTSSTNIVEVGDRIPVTLTLT